MENPRHHADLVTIPKFRDGNEILMLDKLTLEDVNTAIERHLQYKNMKIAMITKDAKSLKKALVSNKKSPMEYNSQKPPEVLAEDKEIEKYRLDIKEDKVKIIDADDMFIR